MKRFLALISLLPLLCVAQTKTPIQLLSPTGSTAGQAIVSTGSNTAPQWSTPGFAAIGGNTVLGNFTGSSVAPSANAVPSCSTANSALKYTTSTGLSCGTAFALTSGNLSQFANTTSAQLATLLSDETGSGAAVFGTSPTIASPTLSGTVAGTPTFSGAVTFSSSITPSQTAGIVGTTTNNNANTGSVGEYVNQQATGVALTTSTATNCTSISLTAGDWTVWGNIEYVPAAGTTLTQTVGSINTLSATLNAAPARSVGNYTSAAGLGQSTTIPMIRLTLTSTATVYMVGFAAFGGGTLSASCYISARRPR